MQDNMESLIQEVPTCHLNEHGNKVFRLFEKEKDLEGIVVLNEEAAAAGLIMRTNFYQKIGKQFGREIYLNRPLELVMNKNILMADKEAGLAEIGILAMNRDQESRYDFILVSDKGRYAGVVSISLFLTELSRRREIEREREIYLLKEQQEILKKANEAEIKHRKIMEEKNGELKEKNNSIKNLLDNAGQGFLSFDSSLVVYNEYSKECLKFFGCDIGGKNFLDLIRAHISSELLETISLVLQKLFPAKSPLEQKVYLSLLPEEIIINSRNTTIEYKVIPHHCDQTMKKVMLILTDITEKKELEILMEEEKNNLKMILKAVSAYSDLSSGIEAFTHYTSLKAREIHNNTQKTDELLSEIFRDIHTFKGDFGQLYFAHTVKQLHELEERISAMADRIEEISDKELLDFLSGVDALSILEKDMQAVRDKLGPDFFDKSETFVISRESIFELETKVQELFMPREQEELLPLIRKLRYTNFKEMLRQYDPYLQNLASRLEKNLEPMHITGPDIYVDKSTYQQFIKSLVHVFRNIVDHGLEQSDERLEAGKPVDGKLECCLELIDDKKISLVISDDGHGIDLDIIRKKAVERNIYSAKKVKNLTEKQLLEIVFLDRFSTKDSVSLVSGRGVGLAAVKSEVVKLGGEISVKTAPGKGTEIDILLPLLEV